MESWRPVPGFEYQYEVSDCGRVRSLDREINQIGRGGKPYFRIARGRYLRPGRMPAGHVSVALGRGNSRCVHELVLLAFVGPAPAGCECRHKNGIANDNRLENLEWSSRGRNTQDKKWHEGTTTTKLWPEDVAELKAMFGKFTRRTIALWFGISVSAVDKIKAGGYHRDI